jgi:hypothetical protein
MFPSSFFITAFKIEKKDQKHDSLNNKLPDSR